MTTDRRTFLQLLSSGALASLFPASISRALEIPAHHRTGTIADVEHVIILMQENRSFDHYFGMLKGVRGFGDPRAIKLPSGDPVWYQPQGGGYVLPFHPTAPDLGLQFLEDLAHDWATTHGAWNNGNYDQWIPNKGPVAMAHLTRKDIPFHYALADAFTICDAYYCSLMGPTDPNRYHMWTGWVGNDGQGGGPVVDNAEAGYDWSTFPERLQKAGISWKIYQDIGTGLDANGSWGWTQDPYIGNYGDTSLLYFHNYQNAQPGSPLSERAKTGTDVKTSGSLFDILRQDVAANRLPQVSWIVAPEAYSEHPNWPANYGAWYVSQVLDILTSKPEIWSKTVLFLTYDENDGFFDHMVPPTPPQSRTEGLSTIDTTNEIFPGNSSYERGPYGLGVRVPMLVVSPWSKGGWVNSQVFDHTSLIQFIERRFEINHPELKEKNITPWRRAVCGDLTSALNFATPNNAKFSLPGTSAYLPPDHNRHPDYTPAPPSEQSLPVQEEGIRPARALPYELHVSGSAHVSDGTFRIHFGNAGKVAAVFQVRSGNSSTGPWTYTVGPRSEISDNWNVAVNGASTYDLSVYGPNGFFRAFQGSIAGKDKSAVEVQTKYESECEGIALHIHNRGAAISRLEILNVYSGKAIAISLRPGEETVKRWELKHSFGWYDFVIQDDADSSFQRQLAGHIETGCDSMTDPAIGMTSKE